MRIIDADELVKKVSEESVHKLKQAWNDSATAEARGMVLTIGCIKNAPTVNVERHGKWLSICEGEGNECSVCGYKYFGGRYKYCPDCGAKMWGDTK